MKRITTRGMGWALILGFTLAAGVAEARRYDNPWTEARRDLERAAHALEGLDGQRARNARRDVQEALKRVRKGETEWTPPPQGGAAREACAQEVKQRLSVHEEDVRVRRNREYTGDGVRVDWWAHKAHNREKSGHCIVRGGQVAQFHRD